MDTDVDIPEIDTSLAEVEDPITDLSDVGEVGDVGEPQEQPNILNLDEYGDHVVDLNGELVPVSELRGGGLRQADYTRKTQELAELRKEAERGITLERSMQVNPEGTLQWLAQQHGLTLAQAQAVANEAQGGEDWWEDSDQPSAMEREVAELRQWREQQDAERQITATFSGLKAKYGDAFNEQEVARAATERGIFDPNLLELVYRDLAYEKITTARTAATTQAATAAQAEEQRRRRAAAEAAASTGASGGAVGTTTTPPPSRNLTVREAAELAWTQLGYD